MKIIAVGMVKDEADIIQYTIENLIRNGVDSFIVGDNMSTDGTKEILQHYNYVEYLYDDIVGYYQSEKMTWMAERAFAEGADWVIPFDADEEWLWNSGGTLRNYLKIWYDMGAMCPNVIRVNICNHAPTYLDTDVSNPFNRIQHCIYSDPRFKKVILSKALKGTQFKIEMGNHDVSGVEIDALDSDELVVHHYPWRSPEQYLRKITNGYNAYYNSSLFGKFGTHWTERRNPAEHPEDVISEYFERHYIAQDSTRSITFCDKEPDARPD